MSQATAAGARMCQGTFFVLFILFIPFFKNSKILLDKILKVYYNRRHDACPHITDIIYMNFSERRRRKEVTFIDAFQRVTGWWEVMCQIVSEYIPELHTE